ncbi:hypothetical protein D3C72_1664470 [compost metagenome]
MPILAQHLAYPSLDQGHPGPLQIIAQGPVEGLPVEQILLIELQVLAIPVHLPRRGCDDFVQGTPQTGMAQALKYPLRNPFNGRETTPLGHHRDRIAQAPQADGGGRAGRAGTEDQDTRISHARLRGAQGR